MMDSKERILSQIHEDWGEKPQSKVCALILEYLLQFPANQLAHITYGRLRNIIGTQYKNSDLLVAIQYLIGEGTKLLEVGFELIEEDDSFPYPLANSEVNLANETGELYHPETGEIVNDYENKVFMYFKPSSLVKAISK